METEKNSSSAPIHANQTPDGDGLPNGEESMYGANPFKADTDGDGASDGTEASQGTDPCNAADEGNVGNVVRVKFEFGDISTSKSEKYRLDIKRVTKTRSLPDIRSFLNRRYDSTDTVVVPLSPGYVYEVSLLHISTNPRYRHYPVPDFDYCLWMTPMETPSGVVLVDDYGIFGKIVTDAASVFTLPPKTAKVIVPKPTVAISKSSLDGWGEMDIGEVVLSDEDMKIDISVVPAVPSLSALKEALGTEYTIVTTTKPEGTSVSFGENDQFVQNGPSSELRITKTRAELNSLGLLPPNDEDGINEMAWVDIVQTQGQSYADSEAFSTLGYVFRGKATLDSTKNLDSDPPNSVPTESFFKAAGCELVTVAYSGATSNKRQIMNQADIFYFSGHGNHRTGKVQGGFSPDMVKGRWCNDLYAAVIAGCAVMDVRNYRFSSQSFWYRIRHLYMRGVYPGEQWENSGAQYLLGYALKAPLDSRGGSAIAEQFVNQLKIGTPIIEAWKRANDSPVGRNACVLDCSSNPHVFWYWDETSGSAVWTNRIKGAKSWIKD